MDWAKDTWYTAERKRIKAQFPDFDPGLIIHLLTG
jgi:hypothetical protein